MAKCNQKTEVYSRVCGYHRPVSNWNLGKQAEFRDRQAYTVPSEEVDLQNLDVVERTATGKASQDVHTNR